MIKIETVKLICDQIQSTNSKLEKEQILKTNKGNALFLKVIYFLLNPFIVTGLSDKKIYKSLLNVNPKSEFKDCSIEFVMNYLRENNTGTDQVIANIQRFIYHQPDSMAEFYIQLFTKSLKLGCDSKTVNKVYGKNFIPTFDVQLANKYFEMPQKVEGKEFTITLKIDGQRCVVVKENGVVSLFSRQGQLIEGLVDIENEIRNHTLDNFVLDGELTLLDDGGMTSGEQYKQTLKITRKDGEKHGIKLLAFDWLYLSDFQEQECKMIYSERREALDKQYSAMQYIKILPVLYTGKDTAQILSILTKVRDDNQEGIMINLNDAVYEFKRTSNLLKVKVMQDCDLKIIGFEEGSGRLSGTLGRINVDYKGNKLGVGSGFSDSDRTYFWAFQSKLIGRVITVQFFEETEDKDGIKSLRFPVYKEIREIGKEVSYN